VKPARSGLAAALLALALAGCGGSSAPPATTALAQSTSTAPTSTEPPSTNRPPLTSVVRSTLAAPSTTSGFKAACTTRVLLPLLKKRLDDPSRQLVVERVDIERCRNGYTHVFAIPKENPPGAPQYDADQLWLQYVDGDWRTVAEGSGIACDDADIDADLLRACRALGERS
jgi:hypothetical protein